MENIQQELLELKGILLKLVKREKEFYSLEEACNYLKISKPSIYKLTSKKEITYYTPGGKKIYFQKQDLDAWILAGKVDTCHDSMDELESFLTKNS